ncbi:NUDIX hydrolase [Streptomyces sp. Tue6028]|uniref:NUDIX hydrolase n=1 Tax=Streptomyces sp. Tue6028 TaxID=2036037 RepID=UPI003D75F0AC
MTSIESAAPQPLLTTEVPGTAALLVDDDGRYLLHLRDANKPIWQPGRWALLGGNTEPGETCAEAMVRELREETGLTVPGLTPFVTVETVDMDGRLKYRVVVYLGTLNRPAHEIPLHEGIQLRWTDAADIVHMVLDPGTTAVVQEHRKHPHPRLDAAGRPPTLRIQETAAQRERSIVGVHLYLERDGTVLLGERAPESAFAPLIWHVPAGHREAGESALTGLIRETAEETGITVHASDLTLVHVVDVRDPGSPVPRLQLFFAASRWQGEPQLLEPDRCTQWRWWPLDALPGQLVEYTRAALTGIARGDTYTHMGWAS